MLVHSTIIPHGFNFTAVYWQDCTSHTKPGHRSLKGTEIAGFNHDRNFLRSGGFHQQKQELFNATEDDDDAKQTQVALASSSGWNVRGCAINLCPWTIGP